jgi:hypothetical protein
MRPHPSRRGEALLLTQMRLTGFAAAALTFYIATPAWCQPPRARSDSQWNLLVEGGKGIFWTAPNCHDRQYFTGSPLRFDFEQEFFGMKESDLRAITGAKYIGVAKGHRVMQVIQQIQQIQTDSHMTAKRLLVERAKDDFCAIYQQLYDDSEVTVRQTLIITFDGRPVLKTMDRNGNHTWNEEYWAFDASGPIYLDLAPVRKQMREAAPKGDDVVTYPFDLNGACHKAAAFRSRSDCADCGAPDGNVIAELVLRGSHLTATDAHWFAPGVSATCHSE